MTQLVQLGSQVSVHSLTQVQLVKPQQTAPVIVLLHTSSL
jgi:hypothetical protein